MSHPSPAEPAMRPWPLRPSVPSVECTFLCLDYNKQTRIQTKKLKLFIHCRPDGTANAMIENRISHIAILVTPDARNEHATLLIRTNVTT